MSSTARNRIQKRQSSGNGTWWATLACACLVLLFPLFTVDIPPILDYPNHLADVWILAFGPQDPVVSRFATPHWQIIPNLAMEALSIPLLKVFPLNVAGRILLAMALLTPFLGAVTYSNALLGKKSHLALVSGLIACNAAFLLGFVNFLISLGAGFFVAALWVRMRARRPVACILAASLLTGVLFLAHLMGLLVFLLLAACHELQQTLGARQKLRRLGQAAASLIPCLIVPAALFLLSPLESAKGFTEWRLTSKFTHALFPFTNYMLALDIATLAIVVCLLACGFATRSLRIHLGSAIALLALAIGYLALPFASKGLAFIDVRFLIAFSFVLFASLDAARLHRSTAIEVSVILALLGVLRTGVVVHVWFNYNTELAQLRETIEPIQPGDKVLEAAVGFIPEQDSFHTWSMMLSDGTGTFGHRASLVLTERRAFWPFLFANPTQQPLVLNPPFRALADATPLVPTVKGLLGKNLTPLDKYKFPLWNQWWRHYDWVLLMDPFPGMSPQPPADSHLMLVHATPEAVLYKVVPETPPYLGVSVDRP